MSHELTISEIVDGLLALDLGDFDYDGSTPNKAKEYAKLLATGQITKEECADLLADLKIQELVVKTATEMEVKRFLSSAIDALLALVGDIPVPYKI